MAGGSSGRRSPRKRSSTTSSTSRPELPYGLTAETAPGIYRLQPSGSHAGLRLRRRRDRLEAVHPPVDRAADHGRAATGPWSTSRPSGPRPPRLAFLGVRACEIAALQIQDRAMRAGPAGDADHAARREASLVVAVECATATGTCFCTSMGTGPEVGDGADIVLSELDDGFVVRAGSEAGAAIVARLDAPPGRPPEQLERAARQVAAVRDRDRRSGRDRRPARAAARRARPPALGARSPSAASPAPTARSSARPASAPASASRRTSTASRASTDRHWDSCFSLGFGRVAGDANFRPKVADRYRQWLTHKFSTWWDQFGSSGCVGCGRCIAWCPVGIDVREELAAIAPPTAPAGPIPWPLSPPRAGRRRALATVAPAIHATATRPLRHHGDARHRDARLRPSRTRPCSAARPGQFVMVELPAFAAPPISISRIRPDGLDLTIRAAGPATAALTAPAPPAPRSPCAARSAAAGRSRPPSAGTSSSSPAGSASPRSAR